MMLPLPLLFWGLSSLVSFTAAYSLPENGLINICFDLTCIISTIKRLSDLDQVIVTYISYNFYGDSYSALYLGQIMDSFSLSDVPVQYLLIESKAQPVAEMGVMLLSLLPRKSIFISLEEGASAFGAFNIGYTRVILGITHAPGIVLHLNHEQPWVTKDILDEDDKDKYDSHNSVNTQEDFKWIYSIMPDIIRNYYYQPYAEQSNYIPLGAPMYGYLIANSTSDLAETIRKPCSVRRTYCHFTGRTTYPKKIYHEQADERKQIFSLAGIEGGENLLKPCTVTTGDENAPVPPGAVHNSASKYEDYITALANTAFVLCPAGNNPETFRHYEALEVGAIPLFVRPPPDKDFLHFGLWREYPGPIFQNWSELKPFMDKMNGRIEEVDKLQVLVREWYVRFQVDRKQFIASILNSVFITKDDKGGSVSETETEGRENERGQERENPFWGEKTPDFGVLREIMLALSPKGKEGQNGMENENEADGSTGKDGEKEEGNVEQEGTKGESMRMEFEVDSTGMQAREVKRDIEKEQKNEKERETGKTVGKEKEKEKKEITSIGASSVFSTGENPSNVLILNTLMSQLMSLNSTVHTLLSRMIQLENENTLLSHRLATLSDSILKD